VEPAVIAEAARWGDAKVATPRNKSTWQSEINWITNVYFPSRGNTVLNQLRTDGLYTTFAAPVFSQHGGTVPANYPLTISGTGGTIYFTTDGVTDPRLIGGGVNPSAAVQAYSGPLGLTGPTTVMARLRTAGGQWSGLVTARFDTVALAGDYNGSGTVDQSDLGVWQANFGGTMLAGVGADGNGDGTVDTADYVLWRKNLGASLNLGAASTVDTAFTPVGEIVAAETSAVGNVLEEVAEPRVSVGADRVSLGGEFRGISQSTAVRRGFAVAARATELNRDDSLLLVVRDRIASRSADESHGRAADVAIEDFDQAGLFVAQDEGGVAVALGSEF
jgi:hypothetical protein